MKENESLMRLISSLSRNTFKMFENITELAYVETQLILKNVGELTFLLPILIVLSFTSWIGICACLCISLIYAGISGFLSIAIVTLINLILVFLLVSHMVKLKKALAYHATRRQLSLVFTSEKGLENEKDSTPVAM